MAKKLVPVLIVSALFMGITLDLSAEELSTSATGIGPSEGAKGEVIPPLSRNPFITPADGRRERISIKSDVQQDTPKKGNQSYGQKRPLNIEDLKVSGILLDGKNPSALIGHRIVKIGDRIDDYIVTEIQYSGVTLSKEEMIIHLNFE